MCCIVFICSAIGDMIYKCIHPRSDGLWVFYEPMQQLSITTKVVIRSYFSYVVSCQFYSWKEQKKLPDLPQVNFFTYGYIEHILYSLLALFQQFYANFGIWCYPTNRQNLPLHPHPPQHHIITNFKRKYFSLLLTSCSFEQCKDCK